MPAAAAAPPPAPAAPQRFAPGPPPPGGGLAGGGRRARPRGPDDAEGVGLVDEQPGPEVAPHGVDLDQGGDVTVHGVDAVDRHQQAAGVGLLAPGPQAPTEAVGPVVAEGAQGALAEAASVDEAGVRR